MKIKLCIFLMWLNSALYGQQDTFSIEIEPIQIENMPGLHSGAVASVNNRWIFIGGRTNGLHGFLSPFAFPNDNKNVYVYVVDKTSGEIWTSSLESFPVNLYEPLTSSNIPFYQDGNTLYMIGGYGWSDAANDFKTFNTLTKIDLVCLHDAIVNQSALEYCFEQIEDAALANCGGNLKKLNNRFYLVFGHRFDGIYSVLNPGNSVFTQRYSNSVKSFEIDATNLGISNLKIQQDSINFHRRDYNLVPQIFPNRSDGLTAFSGVFQYQSVLPYLNTINISEDTAVVAPNFDQHLSQYHSAVMPVYDSTYNVMHNYFFGGMSRFTINPLTQTLVDDTLVPFVKTISCVSRFADGTMEEKQLGISFPDYLGSNMEFIPVENLPESNNHVIQVNRLTEQRTLVGHLVGGIKSPEANISSTAPASSEANTTIYEVYIVRGVTDSGTVSLKDIKNTPSLSSFQCFPNPAVNSTQFKLQLTKKSNVEIVAYDRAGRFIQRICNKKMEAGEQLVSWNVENIPRGTYIIKSRVDGITKSISVLVNP